MKHKNELFSHKTHEEFLVQAKMCVRIEKSPLSFFVFFLTPQMKMGYTFGREYLSITWRNNCDMFLKMIHLILITKFSLILLPLHIFTYSTHKKVPYTFSSKEHSKHPQKSQSENLNFSAETDMRTFVMKFLQKVSEEPFPKFFVISHI